METRETLSAAEAAILVAVAEAEVADILLHKRSAYRRVSGFERAELDEAWASLKKTGLLVRTRDPSGAPRWTLPGSRYEGR